MRCSFIPVLGFACMAAALRSGGEDLIGTSADAPTPMSTSVHHPWVPDKVYVCLQKHEHVCLIEEGFLKQIHMIKGNLPHRGSTNGRMYDYTECQQCPHCVGTWQFDIKEECTCPEPTWLVCGVKGEPLKDLRMSHQSKELLPLSCFSDKMKLPVTYGKWKEGDFVTHGHITTLRSADDAGKCPMSRWATGEQTPAVVFDPAWVPQKVYVCLQKHEHVCLVEKMLVKEIYKTKGANKRVYDYRECRQCPHCVGTWRFDIKEPCTCPEPTWLVCGVKGEPTKDLRMSHQSKELLPRSCFRDESAEMKVSYERAEWWQKWLWGKNDGIRTLQSADDAAECPMSRWAKLHPDEGAEPEEDEKVLNASTE